MTGAPSYVALEPVVAGIVARAAELASREGSTVVSPRHLLWAMLRRPLTPALEGHLLRASESAEDADSSAIGDLHLLLAIVGDELNMGCQVLAHFADRTALLAELQLQVEHFDHVDDAQDTNREEA